MTGISISYFLYIGGVEKFLFIHAPFEFLISSLTIVINSGISESSPCLCNTHVPSAEKCLGATVILHKYLFEFKRKPPLISTSSKILDNINLSTGVLTSPEELEHGLALELKLIFLHSLRASFTCLHPLGS